jgi:hypothetical protein
MTAAPAATVAAPMAATIAPAMPAAVALAAAIVLGQRGLPGQPKLGFVDGEAGRHRDQGQRRTASKKQADRGREGSQS